MFPQRTTSSGLVKALTLGGVTVAKVMLTAQIRVMNVQTPIPAIVRSLAPTPPREFNGVNWIGVQTLYLREVKRFWKIGTQTIAAPVVTTLLYMMVFVQAMHGARPAVGGVSFAQFVGPGLIMMAILNNAFSNSSSSLMQAKVMGTSSDFLSPPLSPLELTVGFTAGAITRGLIVGLVTAITVWPFARFGLAQPWAVVYYCLIASTMMALVGVFTGLWSEKFDHLAAATNFIIMPLTFLSGTFYRVSNLPQPFATLSQFNPFFYLIDGFRYGFTGHSDGSITIGVVSTLAVTLALGVGSYLIFRSGWRLKS